MARDEPVQIGIVERSGNCVRAKAPKIADMTQGLEIAEMAGHTDFWTGLASDMNPLAFLGHFNVLSPVRFMKLALELRYLAGHEQHVLPHPPRDVVSFSGDFLRKRDPKIFIDNAAADTQNIRRQPGQPFAGSLARFNANGLDERERNADCEVFGQMAQIAEGH
jgi:hypothetical protein